MDEQRKAYTKDGEGEYLMKLIDKYLQCEENQACAHCKKAAPTEGKTVCGKCSKELEAFRNKKTKTKDDLGKG